MSDKLKKFLMILATVAMVLLQWALDSCNTDPGHDWKTCTHDVVAKNVTGSDDLGGATYDVAILDFEDGLSHEEVLERGKALGLTLIPHESEPLVDKNLYLARVGEGEVPKLKAHLSHFDSGIQAVDEDHRVTGYTWAPNDPFMQFQWHMDQIEVKEAWTLSTGRRSVVAVIDTGVSMPISEGSHKPVQDLMGTGYVPGYDFVDDDALPWDKNGHGTHVAGTVAQTTDNKYGGVGVAYGSSIMPIRVLDNSGSGTLADVVAGIYFAANNGAHVINMSLGSPHPTDVEQEAVTYAWKSGTTVIAAAGNRGKRMPSYPASLDHVISVSATQYDKNTAPYSQWGPTVDIAAPGGNTLLDQNQDGKPDGVLQETVKQSRPDEHVFALYQGTSMATPHVAGVAALINQWGVTHPDRVDAYLKKGADESYMEQEAEEDEKPKSSKLAALYGVTVTERPTSYPEKEFRERYGAGIVQADSAVTAAITEPGLLRLLIALALGCLLFVLARQKSLLEADVRILSVFLTVAAFSAAGLFVLPFVIPGMEIPTVAFVVQLLATPMMAWDWVIAGIGQSPLLANAVIPIFLLLLTHNMPRVKYVTSGLAVGFAAFMLAEMVLLTSPLLFIPAGDLGARVFYFLNALAILGVTYFSLSDAPGNPEPGMEFPSEDPEEGEDEYEGECEWGDDDDEEEEDEWD